MSNGFPSMTALLGLLAVAGFQNRDKLGELLGGLGQGSAPASPQGGNLSGPESGSGGLGGVLGSLASSLGGGNAGGFLNGGLGELINKFRQNGHGAIADSWVNPGTNRDISPQQLQEAVGPDVLDTLSQQTGLTRDELLRRLSARLPEAVDKYTPDGRLPA